MNKQSESQLQAACVRWFRLQYPLHASALFAVPNGGFRNAREAARMKKEGVTSGVSDLILLLPNKTAHGLCIEMKAGRNKPTDSQVAWLAAQAYRGYAVAVCRSFEEFEATINNYIKSL